MAQRSSSRPRRPYVGGNWKMNTDLASAVELADDIASGCESLIDRCDVAVFPPFPYLQAVGKTLGHHGVKLGAQDVYPEPSGAFTGEVGLDMLLDLNVQVVLVGHSERRHIIGEDDDLVNRKLLATIAAGIDVILCIGETLEQRHAGQTEAVNLRQLREGLCGVEGDQLRHVTIAYEPVWAIGTGVTASPDDAEAVHRFIRADLQQMHAGAMADAVRIIYGGSVKASNAKELFEQPTIDGGLIGGSSLKAAEFLAIVKAAASAKDAVR
jgi:triosephosphate isomerase